MKFIRIVFCILVPPIGVFLTAGVSSALLINILLTLLGWLPGVIHAIWLLQKTEERQNQAY
ncbi:MAG: YqaE/Pmp3 family membrane protein [Leptolyngbyaceae cyanobacterium CSU_1_3]|nr:YqaE/Pmp3 family membrane protein [Leptolyngbyaceae cyanobacterium CSU_1_3]